MKAYKFGVSTGNQNISQWTVIIFFYFVTEIFKFFKILYLLTSEHINNKWTQLWFYWVTILAVCFTSKTFYLKIAIAILSVAMFP